MALLATIAGGIAGAAAGTISYASSLVGEGWTRYFILLGGLVLSNFIGNIVNFYPIESLIGYVVSSVFTIPGFTFPIWGGVSSLVIITAMVPVVFFSLKSGISYALG